MFLKNSGNLHVSNLENISKKLTEMQKTLAEYKEKMEKNLAEYEERKKQERKKLIYINIDDVEDLNSLKIFENEDDLHFYTFRKSYNKYKYRLNKIGLGSKLLNFKNFKEKLEHFVHLNSLHSDLKLKYMISPTTDLIIISGQEELESITKNWPDQKLPKLYTIEDGIWYVACSTWYN
jgi:hypothetical protein